MNGYTTALIVLEFFIAFLFYPLRVGAKGHASLAHDRIALDFTVFKLPVARLRIKKEEHKFSLLVNGKVPKSNTKISAASAINAVKQYRIEGIHAKGNLLALISAADAKNTAMAYALAVGALKPLVQNVQIFTAEPSDTLEIDGRIRLKINVVQIVGLLVAAIRG